MQSQNPSKLHETTQRQKIFNVRKRAYKHFDNQKYLKYNYTPVLKKQPFESIHNVLNNKKMEYHYQLAIMTSPKYKQLEAKYKELKEQNRRQKQLKMNIIREKENELKRYIYERQRLIDERERLDEKRQQIKEYINEMRQQRQYYHMQNMQRNHIFNSISAEQLKSTIMALQYQGGIDIDTDNMTYEQLLQLQERMGKVSKGLSEQQYKQLQIISALQKHEAEVCSICYQGIKSGQNIHELKCHHMYHCQCIKQWFNNQKTCPLCKQEVFNSQKN